MRMDMSWKPLTQLPQATSPGPVSPPSPFSHHVLGLLQIACSGSRFPFQLNSLLLCPRPINARWLSLNRRSNQGLMRLISRNLGRFVFSNKPSFLGFSFASRSLATSWLARSTTCKEGLRAGSPLSASPFNIATNHVMRLKSNDSNKVAHHVSTK